MTFSEDTTTRADVEACSPATCDAPDCAATSARVVSGLGPCCTDWGCAGWALFLCREHTAYADDSLLRMTDIEWRDL